MYFIATWHLHDLTWWLVLFTGLWAVFPLARTPGPLALDAKGTARRPDVFQCPGHPAFAWPVHSTFRVRLCIVFAGGAAGLDPRAAIFFGLIHPLIMLAAVVLGQVGFSVSKRLSDDRRKYVIATGCYTAALAVVLLTVLWAWFSYERSLLPYHATPADGICSPPSLPPC